MIKEKNENDEVIEYLMEQILSKSMTYKEKKIYTQKLLKYIRLKIEYYKTMGIDVSLGTLILGMGLGVDILEKDNTYLPFVFYGLGGTELLLTTIKRKIKYKNKINNIKKNKKEI